MQNFNVSFLASISGKTTVNRVEDSDSNEIITNILAAAREEMKRDQVGDLSNDKNV